MRNFVKLGRLPGFVLVAAAGSVAAMVARAEPISASNMASAVPTAALVRPAPTPPCNPLASQTRFDFPLSRMARRIAAGLPIKVVAIGSSSTAGAGASSPEASYPSRLSVELQKLIPGHEFSVLNRGVNGEEARDMLARFETDVVAERPHLVLWQVGTNAVLRDRPIDSSSPLLRAGVARLKEIGADIVLIDLQYSPKVLAKSNAEAMVSTIADVARFEKVDLFRRYALMRNWSEVDHLPFDTFVSADGLHMNDWSYACVARSLAGAIAEASQRPTATVATAPPSATR